MIRWLGNDFIVQMDVVSVTCTITLISKENSPCEHREFEPSKSLERLFAFHFWPLLFPLLMHQAHFPVEIWRHIFSFSTEIEDRDEFSLEDQALGMMPCNQECRSSHLTHEELRSILRIRLSIVRVCRHWYDIGIRALWSHFRIQRAKWQSQIFNLEEVLGEKPEFGLYVVRITIEDYEQESRYSYWSPSKRRELTKTHVIRKLTNVKIISCPFGEIISLIPPNAQVASIGFTNRQPMGYVLERRHIAPLCMLRSITLGDRVFSPRWTPNGKIEFPALTTLRTHMETVLCPYITLYWEMPILRTLSFMGTNQSGGTRWIKLLEQCRLSIREVDMSCWAEMEGEECLPFDMPLLSSLAFDPSEGAPWNRFIQAPAMHRISMYNIDFVEDFESSPTHILALAKEVISSYPGTAHFYIYERGRALSPTTRYGLRREDLISLGDGRIEIEVRRDSRIQIEKTLVKDSYRPHPLDLVNNVIKDHPDLRRIRETLSFSYLRLEDSLWRAICSLGSYRTTGEGETVVEAENNATSHVLEMIREDIY